jgi:probable HAF family extracellular repeat protein
MTLQQFIRKPYHLALLVPLVLANPAAAQQRTQAHRAERFPHYVVQDLGTLGGPYSFAYNLNNAGVVSGGAAGPTQNGDPSQSVNNAPQTAFIWAHGKAHDLGTLGGPDSAAAAANLVHQVAVDSETKSLSRAGEDVCGFGTNLQCLAGTKKDGRLSPLPLLPDGNNSYALDMNDRGQIVGFADTGEYDLDCASARTAGYRFQSVLWEPDGTIRQLAKLDGDTVAFAFGINNKGQIVGASGVCPNLTPPPYPSPGHAVLWNHDGTVTNLGALASGAAVASAINEHGDVSGTSPDSGGLPQAFLWTPETHKLVQLQLPNGFVGAINPCCKTINDKREIVGSMFDAAFNSRAFLWKDGSSVDLNSLVINSPGWVLQSAAGINASGQITGQGTIGGEVHAFLATPCHRHEAHGDCCEVHAH